MCVHIYMYAYIRIHVYMAGINRCEGRRHERASAADVKTRRRPASRYTGITIWMHRCMSVHVHIYVLNVYVRVYICVYRNGCMFVCISMYVCKHACKHT